MKIRLPTWLYRFVVNLIQRFTSRLFLHALTTKTYLIESMLGRYPDVARQAEQDLARWPYAYTRSSWIEQQIRLDIRRGRRLYREAVSMYTDYHLFEGPLLISTRLDLLEQVLSRISEAYRETNHTIRGFSRTTGHE